MSYCQKHNREFNTYCLACQMESEKSASKGTVTQTIKTTREVTGRDLLDSLRKSMIPIFAHFQEEIDKCEGKTLHIDITAQDGSVNLKYGFSDL